MTDPYANAPATSTAAQSTAAQPFPPGPMPQRFARQSFPPGTVPRYRPAQQQGNGIGTAGFVLGLIGLLLCWVPIVGVLCGLLGVVFGGCGMSAGRRNGTGTGLAIAGLVLGIVSLVPAVIIIVAVAASA